MSFIIITTLVLFRLFKTGNNILRILVLESTRNNILPLNSVMKYLLAVRFLIAFLLWIIKLKRGGREYYGEIVSQDERSITIDIAKAYKDSAKKLLVEYRTEREGVIVTYRCDGIKEKVIFRFISFIEPKIIENRVFIDTMEITTSLAVCPKISKREYAKYLGKAGVAYTIDYELKKTGNIVASFSFGF